MAFTIEQKYNQEPEAFVFQHVYTGVQIFVYHAHGVEDAKHKFKGLVIDPESWTYLTQKKAI